MRSSPASFPHPLTAKTPKPWPWSYPWFPIRSPTGIEPSPRFTSPAAFSSPPFLASLPASLIATASFRLPPSARTIVTLARATRPRPVTTTRRRRPRCPTGRRHRSTASARSRSTPTFLSTSASATRRAARTLSPSGFASLSTRHSALVALTGFGLASLPPPSTLPWGPSMGMGRRLWIWRRRNRWERRFLGSRFPRPREHFWSRSTRRIGLNGKLTSVVVLTTLHFLS